jgi:hypothetical protein
VWFPWFVPAALDAWPAASAVTLTASEFTVALVLTLLTRPFFISLQIVACEDPFFTIFFSINLRKW